ncbi:tripartite tricarboxylate transporter substrate binding protein [Variovorax terrae]|uniref:Tripartite tricarboxylate transporter substrate binding protein n=1 Tax=Variovorax terrae TaxID=2923278 RepID=A0A9X1VRC1_9BURK|nr:tripartite tricarboxylate transporter substrate binding protein [Variovorax terrae]MCJ0762386.1 tripartite tricarboxylate transporter substrate binding protein [Variovorax terrae]
MNRRDALALTAFALAATGSRAQSFPTRPLRIIVPFTPGGTTDVVSRLVAVEMGRSLGQPVVVENKPGAGTVIGVDAGAKAAPDGYTLTCVANSFTVNHTLIRKLPYDTFKDLRPVGLMGLSEHVLAVHPSVKARTLRELAQLSRSEKLSYGSFGNGTSAHLSGELLRSAAGVQAVHVPYKGQAPALNDLLGGQLTMMFGNWPEFAAHIRAGKLVAIGMATRQRSVFAPDVPTLAEQGTLIESNSWNGLLAPAATPDALVQQLNAEVNKALAAPAVKEAFAKGGIVAQAGSAEQFGTYLRSEAARYARIIEEAKISLEG